MLTKTMTIDRTEKRFGILFLIIDIFLLSASSHIFVSCLKIPSLELAIGVFALFTAGFYIIKWGLDLYSDAHYIASG